MSKPSLDNLLAIFAGKGPQIAKKDLRIIKTARTEEAINLAVKDGFFPLMRPSVPSPEIHSRLEVYQDSETGQIQLGGDLRSGPEDYGDTYKCVVSVSYYPYQFPSPFAAYLIPKGLEAGERVILDDVIEDIVGGRWQGNTYRLDKCEAIWNGRTFKLQIPEVDTSQIG